ncbi:MAG TPA: acylphosphatase [Roseivirga sp.]
MLKAIKIKVSGRVQGVFFRASTQIEAQKRGLKGWCMNLPDGRVEIYVEGEPEALDQLIKWCQSGPPMARVDECLVEEAEPLNYQEFSIRRN